MCKQHGTAILGQFTDSLFGLPRPHSDAQAAEMAQRALESWVDDPRRIRSAFGRLADATNEARRLACLPADDPNRRMAVIIVDTMDGFASTELQLSRQFGEIINVLNASLYSTPRQAAIA